MRDTAAADIAQRSRGGGEGEGKRESQGKGGSAGTQTIASRNMF